METTPQAVTERYVSNLINYGRNREFDIKVISQHDYIVHDTHVGVYYSTLITPIINSDGKGQSGVGATISQAVRNALTKHGVTFR